MRQLGVWSLTVPMMAVKLLYLNVSHFSCHKPPWCRYVSPLHAPFSRCTESDLRLPIARYGGRNMLDSVRKDCFQNKLSSSTPANMMAAIPRLILQM